MNITVDGKKQPADYERIIGILKAANYRGWLALEYEDKPDPKIAVPKHLDKLRKLIG